MQTDVKLSGEAAALARQYEALLRRLPVTVAAFVLGELQKWPRLFPAEHRYQRTLLGALDRMPRPDLDAAAAGILRVEEAAGIRALRGSDAARLQDEAQALLRKHRFVTRWRAEVDAFFRTVEPAIESELHPPDAPRRLVVQIYGAEIAVQPHNLWSRLGDAGVRVPLDLQQARGRDGFLRALFGRPVEGAGTALLGAPQDTAPPDVWLIEAHEALHELAADIPGDRPGTPATPPSRLVRVSYDRLRPYRDELTRALYRKIMSGVESPQAFAAYARSLSLSPAPDALPASTEVLHAFIRDLFLTGNGTLFVNNTFVEWAAVQALRRAQPRVLVTRYGVRDRLKPFSSLLLFSQPRPSDRIPMIEDPVGSFVDVEQLSYYVWLNAEKSPGYRGRTLYLFLAEGIDTMLALRSGGSSPASSGVEVATLADVYATMTSWLGLSGGTGRPIQAILG